MKSNKLLVATVLIFVFPCGSGEATPPRPDVTVKVERAVVTSKDKDGLSVRVELRLEAVKDKDLKNIALDVRMFDYINGSESNERSVLSQNLSGPIPGTIPVETRLPGSGTYVIEAKVAGKEAGMGFSHIARAYLVADAKGNVSLVAPGDFKHKENLANIKKLPRSLFSTASPASADGWALTVSMLIQYVDSSGNTVPLPYATVEVWEDDAAFDDFLGAFTTNAAGRASPTVGVPTDPLGTDEIYLIVKTQNGSRFKLGTASRPSSSVSVYKYTNTDTKVFQGQGTVNITFTIANAARELGVWSIFNKIRDYVTAQLSFSPKTFNIWFPSSGADEAYFVSSLNLIAIGDNYAQSDMVIAHEFGHDFMWQINNEWMPEAGGPHFVCPGSAIDNKLAWSEGYATAFALSATNSPDGVFHWTPGDTGWDIEHYSCSFDELDTDEFRVAAAIWDFVDANNDCNEGSQDKGRDGYCDQNQPYPISVKDAYYNAVKGQQQETTMPYWWYLHDNFMNANQQPLAENIMRYNWSVFTDSVINSFYTKCVDTPQRCGSGAYDFMSYWNATGESCQVSVSHNNGPWVVRSNACVGSTGGVASWASEYAVKLIVEGWGTVQQILQEPTIDQQRK